MRFGIIGTSFITEWFLRSVISLDDFDLKAVYSRNIEKAITLGKKYGATLFFDDLASLAGCEEIDAVYIASPNSLHAQQAILLMEAKKHILCEKPAASNSREVSAMLTCAEKNGVVFMEASRHIHTPSLEVIRATLPRLGTLRRVSLLFNQYSDQYEQYKAKQSLNSFNPAFSAGGLMDLGVYGIELMVALFGNPLRIAAMGTILPDSIDVAGSLIMQYDDFVADISYSKASRGVTPCVFEGELGSLIIPHISMAQGATLLMRGDSRNPLPLDAGTQVDISYDQDPRDMMYEVQRFLQFASGQTVEDVHSLKDFQKITLNSMMIMDEARRQMGIHFPADGYR